MTDLEKRVQDLEQQLEAANKREYELILEQNTMLQQCNQTLIDANETMRNMMYLLTKPKKTCSCPDFVEINGETYEVGKESLAVKKRTSVTDGIYGEFMTK
jgi:chromosomal replication initiation ATPase DnaA